MSNPEDLLSFREFPETHGNSGNSSAPRININSPVRTNYSIPGINETTDPLNELVNDMTNSVNFLNNQQDPSDKTEFGNGQKQQSQIYSFWSIEYYQQFFNVDTLTVIDRIVNSIIPKRAPTNYLKAHIGVNPDLYGPFWITVTLIFSIAISGNIANYLQYGSVDYNWRYDFRLVSYAATALFIYSVIVPFTLWALFKWSLKPIDTDLDTETGTYTPSLLSLMCIYGYSLSIFIPVSILLVIQVSYFQWLLITSATLLSGFVLIFVLTPALRNSNMSLFLMIGIISAHFLLGAGFILYFFHVSDEMSTPSVEKMSTTAKGNIATVVNITQNIKI